MLQQANRQVTVHSFGLKSNPTSFGVALREHAELQKQQAYQAQLDEKLANESELEHQRVVTENIVRAASTPAKAAIASNRIYNEGKAALFTEVFEQIVVDALVLDDEFVTEHVDGFKYAARTFLNEQGGYALLENGKTPFLTRLKAVCEATARKVSARKLKEMQADGNVILNFTMNDEEQKEHDRKLQDLSIDQVSELVRNKTIAVIKDEKNRQQKEKEIEEDLKAHVDEAEEGNVKENTQRLVDRLSHESVKETTLFHSLMHRAYREMLEGIASVTSDEGDEDDDENPEMYNTHTTSKDIQENEYEGSMTAQEESRQHEQTSDDLDMDLVLAEAIGQYTLMETVYTLGLVAYDHDAVRKMVLAEMNRR